MNLAINSRHFFLPGVQLHALIELKCQIRATSKAQTTTVCGNIDNVNSFFLTPTFFTETSPPIDVSRLESVDGSIIVEGTTLESIKFPQLQQIKPKDDGR